MTQVVGWRGNERKEMCDCVYAYADGVSFTFKCYSDRQQEEEEESERHDKRSSQNGIER